MEKVQDHIDSQRTRMSTQGASINEIQSKIANVESAIAQLNDDSGDAIQSLIQKISELNTSLSNGESLLEQSESILDSLQSDMLGVEKEISQPQLSYFKFLHYADNFLAEADILSKTNISSTARKNLYEMTQEFLKKAKNLKSERNFRSFDEDNEIDSIIKGLEELMENINERDKKANIGPIHRSSYKSLNPFAFNKSNPTTPGFGLYA